MMKKRHVQEAGIGETGDRDGEFAGHGAEAGDTW